MERNLVEEERRIKAVATDPLAVLLTAIQWRSCNEHFKADTSIRNPV